MRPSESDKHCLPHLDPLLSAPRALLAWNANPANKLTMAINTLADCASLTMIIWK
jgi:hypothetical protein